MLHLLVVAAVLSSSIGDSAAFNCTNGTNPCLNGGDCVEDVNVGSGYTCDCTDMYYGDNCETESPCKSKPCLGVSTCSRNGDVAVCSCESGRLGDRCQTLENPCDFQWKSCKNGGACTVDANDAKGFTCKCWNPLWAGPTCSDHAPCSPARPVKYCKNGGFCLVNMDGTVSCSCSGAFHNTTCQHENKCFSKPCQGSNSSCTYLMNDYTCQCEAGRIGRNCEHLVADACKTAAANCLNGAQCVNDVQQKYGYKCNCPAGNKWLGEHCEIRNHCLGNACANSATCKNEKSAGMDYTCSCTVGFHGATCQYEDKCVGKPCQGANSVCTKLNNVYECKCESGRNGTNCQNDLNNPCTFAQCALGELCSPAQNAAGYICKKGTGESGSDDEGSIIGGVVAGVVVVLIVAVVLIVCLRRRRNRTKKQVKLTGFSQQLSQRAVADFPPEEASGNQPKKFYDNIPVTTNDPGYGKQNALYDADGEQIYFTEGTPAKESGQQNPAFVQPAYDSV